MASAAIPVVVLSYNGTEPLLQALWKKNYSGAFKLVSVPEQYSLLDVIAGILADNEIASEFVLAQANVIPLTRMTLEDLKIPAVYVSGNGTPQYSSHVPTLLSKDKLAGILSSISRASDFDAEHVMKDAAIREGRPIEVSHSFGNYIVRVFSGNPCHHKVIEGLLRKRFMGTTLTGWNAIEGELQSFLKSKAHE